MKDTGARGVKYGGAIAIALVIAVVAFQNVSGRQRPIDDANLTYLSGQNVVPIYHGFEENPDGTFTMHFGYLNRNWQEEVDIPVGENNTFTPAPFAADLGQPTHFLPRNNRWQFSVRVPADWGTRDLVWTLNAKGTPLKAHGNLKPGYLLDRAAILREYAGGSPEGNKAPVVKVEGAKQRRAKVGESVPLDAVVADDGIPKGPRPRGRTDSPTGGGLLRVAQGLRFVWLQYRGAGKVTFDPKQFDAWENEKWNSPWAYGWPLPAIPKDNRWVVNVTFPEAGTYVLRGYAGDGGMWAWEDITFIVTP